MDSGCRGPKAGLLYYNANNEAIIQECSDLSST